MQELLFNTEFRALLIHFSNNKIFHTFPGNKAVSSSNAAAARIAIDMTSQSIYYK